MKHFDVDITLQLSTISAEDYEQLEKILENVVHKIGSVKLGNISWPDYKWEITEVSK